MLVGRRRSQACSSENTDTVAAGMKTGPVTEPPPPVSSELKDALVSSSEQDPKGHNAPGQEDLSQGATDGSGKKEKTEKERTDPL